MLNGLPVELIILQLTEHAAIMPLGSGP